MITLLQLARSRDITVAGFIVPVHSVINLAPRGEIIP